MYIIIDVNWFDKCKIATEVGGFNELFGFSVIIDFVMNLTFKAGVDIRKSQQNVTKKDDGKHEKNDEFKEKKIPTYNEVRSTFLTEYDRSNPVTAHESIKKWIIW